MNNSDVTALTGQDKENAPVPAWGGLPDGVHHALWQPEKLAPWARSLSSCGLAQLEAFSSPELFVEELLKNPIKDKGLSDKSKKILASGLYALASCLQETKKEPQDSARYFETADKLKKIAISINTRHPNYAFEAFTGKVEYNDIGGSRILIKTITMSNEDGFYANCNVFHPANKKITGLASENGQQFLKSCMVRIFELMALSGHKPSQELIWDANDYEASINEEHFLIEHYLAVAAYRHDPYIETSEMRTSIAHNKVIDCRLVRSSSLETALVLNVVNRASSVDKNFYETGLVLNTQILCMNEPSHFMSVNSPIKMTVAELAALKCNSFLKLSGAFVNDFENVLLKSLHHPFYQAQKSHAKNIPTLLGNIYAQQLQQYLSSQQDIGERLSGMSHHATAFAGVLSGAAHEFLVSWKALSENFPAEWLKHESLSAPSKKELEAIHEFLARAKDDLTTRRKWPSQPKNNVLTPVVAGSLHVVLEHIEAEAASSDASQIEFLYATWRKTAQAMKWAPEQWERLVPEKSRPTTYQSAFPDLIGNNYINQKVACTERNKIFFGSALKSVREDKIEAAQVMINAIQAVDPDSESVLAPVFAAKLHASLQNQNHDLTQKNMSEKALPNTPLAMNASVKSKPRI